MHRKGPGLGGLGGSQGRTNEICICRSSHRAVYPVCNPVCNRAPGSYYNDGHIFPPSSPTLTSRPGLKCPPPPGTHGSTMSICQSLTCAACRSRSRSCLLASMIARLCSNGAWRTGRFRTRDFVPLLIVGSNVLTRASAWHTRRWRPHERDGRAPRKCGETQTYREEGCETCSRIDANGKTKCWRGASQSLLVQRSSVARS